MAEFKKISDYGLVTEIGEETNFLVEEEGTLKRTNKSIVEEVGGKNVFIYIKQLESDGGSWESNKTLDEIVQILKTNGSTFPMINFVVCVADYNEGNGEQTWGYPKKFKGEYDDEYSHPYVFLYDACGFNIMLGLPNEASLEPVT